MAVKVMLAPALAQRGPAAAPPPTGQAPGARPRAEAETKPKRRRSSVYDAEGNEVFITLMCLKCHKMRPLVQFGLRRMADGAIRNQPWCRTCRSDKGTGTSRRRAARPAGEETAAETALVESAPRAEQPLDAGLLAAQVVAALHGGRR